ncbi:MAG: cytochrome d ubiquinol oxidase subunit II [Ignavibacteria bacterium]
METFWFIALGFMLIMYVILDGFDLGTGIFYLKAAKTDNERRTLLNAIGPVWDGNEVWLIAAGGTLFFAFPKLYASSFSGFYLPLTIVLWLLIGRALGIELRKHLDNKLWRSFWDAVFCLSSLLLAVFFGAAFGNIIRGVPLGQDGYFFEALWTTFTVVPESGILDWFTILMSLVAVSVLTSHGANYIAMKTTGNVQESAKRISKSLNPVILLLSVIMFAATSYVRPGLWDNYLRHVWGFVFPLMGMGGLACMVYFRYKNDDMKSFVSSAIFIFGMISGTAFGLYPNLLPSSIKPEYNLTIQNAKAGDYGLKVGAIWWIIGMILAIAYFIYLFYSFRGKVVITEDSEGY